MKVKQFIVASFVLVAVLSKKEQQAVSQVKEWLPATPENIAQSEFIFFLYFQKKKKSRL